MNDTCLTHSISPLTSLEALDRWLKEGEEFGLDARRTAFVLVGNKSDNKSDILLP